ncbi:MAG TPA: hypothetical protein VGK33_10810 [Chloroflexota bacterium]
MYPGRWPEISWGDRRVWWLQRYRDAHDGAWPVCVVCGTSWELSSGRLHHRRYAKPGRERWEDLVPLCEPDQKAFKNLMQHNSALRRLPREQATDKAIAYLHAKLKDPVTP